MQQILEATRFLLCKALFFVLMQLGLLYKCKKCNLHSKSICGSGHGSCRDKLITA